MEKKNCLQKRICHKFAPSKDFTISPPKLKHKAPKKINNGPGKFLTMFIMFVKLIFVFPSHTA